MSSVPSAIEQKRQREELKKKRDEQRRKRNKHNQQAKAARDKEKLEALKRRCEVLEELHKRCVCRSILSLSNLETGNPPPKPSIDHWARVVAYLKAMSDPLDQSFLKFLGQHSGLGLMIRLCDKLGSCSLDFANIH